MIAGAFTVLFPSVLFILYFLPAALALYWAFSFSRAAQNVCLFVLSLVFYAWGEPLYLLPMLFLIAVNHVLGLKLDGAQFPAYRRKVIALAVVLNIGTLLLVRYGTTVAAAVADLIGADLALPELKPPLGIAFFTLQALAYLFDIRRGKVPPERNIINTGLYIAFFPTVLAGPILRFADIAVQLRTRSMTLGLFGQGCERFIVGLAKLTVLAAPLGGMAETIFVRSAAGVQFYNTPVLLAWLALLAYGLQVYMSLSGYSDMAIGLARMFGFSLKENFRHPYMAHTVAEFWNRWHISLFRWFYVYVFLVLGGSRARLVQFRGALRPRNFVLRNLFIMWLLIGLWHGISLNHLLFGLWFFIFALFEWLVSLRRRNTGSPLWHVYLLCVVAISLVFLRCASLGETMRFFSNLLGVGGNGFFSDLAVVLARENWTALALGLLFSTPIGHHVLDRLRDGNAVGFAGTLRAVGYVAALAGMFFIALVYLSRAGAVLPGLY
jgi:alginate O-acetyltransferase complex protein AlgI